MADEGTKTCPRCEGEGKYYDKKSHLVKIKCKECGGTGKVSG